jgi:hypothetical protein
MAALLSKHGAKSQKHDSLDAGEAARDTENEYRDLFAVAEGVRKDPSRSLAMHGENRAIMEEGPNWSIIQGTVAGGGDGDGGEFVVKRIVLWVPRARIRASEKRIPCRWRPLGSSFLRRSACGAISTVGGQPNQAGALKGSGGGKAQSGNMSLTSRARSRKRRGLGMRVYRPGRGEVAPHPPASRWSKWPDELGMSRAASWT